MSSTRRAADGASFRQERFASSAKIERGLMGNLIAKRAELLEDESDRALIWWIQYLSWQPGGLAKLAKDLTAKYPGRLTSVSMQKFGCKTGQTYSQEKAQIISDEIKYRTDEERLNDMVSRAFRHFGDRLAEKLPDTADYYLAECRKLAGKELEVYLAELCLDPDLDLHGAGPRYFPSLIETLREELAASITLQSSAQVITALGREVWDTLDYCQQSRQMVLIDGLARTGKTHAAKAWVALRPGQARYVQVPSTNDDKGFFRAIARALGVSINQNSKAQDLRDRIEDVLHTGHITLVFDEAHYAWPQSNYRDALPGRVNWIMTALVNQGVPVALVTTPQFMRTQQAIERRTCWTSEQFTGRIGEYRRLPEKLSAADFTAVAKFFLPEGCAKSIELLTSYAMVSVKYLAAISLAVSHARHNAAKANRQKVIFSDVRTAISGSAIPSDNALNLALAQTKKSGRSRALPAPETASEEIPAALSAPRRAEALIETENNFPRRQTNLDAEQEKFTQAAA